MARASPEFDPVAAALAIAEAHPDATLPCPMCPSPVRAENLARHLESTHARPSSSPAAAPPARAILRGVDRHARRPLAVVFLSWAVLASVSFAVFPRFGDAQAGLLGATFALAFAPLGAALLGLLRARVELEGPRVRLRSCFGLVVREVALPAEIATGRAIERRAVPGTHQLEAPPGEDVDAGTFLRLGGGSRSITLVAKKATGLGKSWAPEGWTKGPATRRWDITVDRTALVAVEYYLASLGLLRPRAS